MKILIIAKADSIHTVRWINQIRHTQWKIVVYPSDRKYYYRRELGIYIKQNKVLTFLMRKVHNNKVRAGIALVLNQLLAFFFSKNYEEIFLKRAIHREKPDIIHTLETQSAGYLFLRYLIKYGENDLEKRWWHTNWGSDIYLFGRFREHKEKISDLLSRCSYYSCEAHRDIDLALKFGFKGTIFSVYPNTGGFDIDHLIKLREGIKDPSMRNIILVKGYQGWAGRSLVALRALTRAKDVLKGYKILIFSSSGTPDVAISAELLSLNAGIEVSFIPDNTEHNEMLKHFGNSRIYIGLSISDSISTSAIEAMSMGCFPIQSDTSTLDEWINNGISGLMVPAEDPEDIEKAIRIAITDNNLVDEAARLNWDVVTTRLDYKELQELTINSYLRIFNILNGNSILQ